MGEPDVDQVAEAVDDDEARRAEADLICDTDNGPRSDDPPGDVPQQPIWRPE
jgi:hypothetical protein